MGLECQPSPFLFFLLACFAVLGRTDNFSSPFMPRILSDAAGQARDLHIRDASHPFRAKGTSRESYYRCADYNPLKNGEKNIVEFRCLDGMCIFIDHYCNGFPNCRDGSDEPDTCPKSDSAQPDCDDGYEEWLKKWSLKKKAWCCQHSNRGCPPQAQAPYTCEESWSDTFSEESEGEAWSDEERIWCCSTKGLGCTKKVIKDAGSTTTVTTTTLTTITTVTTVTVTTTPTWTWTATYTSVTVSTVTYTWTWTSVTATTTTPTATTLTATTSTVSTITQTWTMTTTSVTTTSVTTTTVDPVAATMACSEESVSYLPIDMEGQTLEQVADVAACQSRCSNVNGCAHFSYWMPFRHCHLQDASAALQEEQMSFVAGPPTCPDKLAMKVQKLLDSAALSEAAESSSVGGRHKFSELGLYFSFGGISSFGFLLAYVLVSRLRSSRRGCCSSRSTTREGDDDDDACEYGVVATRAQQLLLPVAGTSHFE